MGKWVCYASGMQTLRGILVGVISGLLLVACSTLHESGFADLRPGMSESEVRALLGEPSVVVPGMRDDEGELLTGPRWQYGDNLSTLATARAFPGTVPARVWAVTFGVDGRVIGFRAPVRADVSGRPVVEGQPVPQSTTPSAIPPRNR